MRKWEYFIAPVFYEVTQRGGLLRKEKGHWVIGVPGEEYPTRQAALEEGLTQLGERGWELVATSLARIPVSTYGLTAGRIELYETFQWLLFKRPKPSA